MTMSLEEAAKLFHGFSSAHHAKEARLEALDAVGAILSGEAKRLIGSFGPSGEWPQLAESTQRDRVSKGFEPNKPLLRTGELRAAIEYQVDPEGRFVEVGVPAGLSHADSNATVGEIGAWMEFGTSTIPPRPFLAGAAVSKGQQAADVAGFIIAESALSDRIDHQILHLAIEAIRRLGEAAHDLVEPDDEENNERQ